ncbi:hypothetical protein K501DRAFT_288386 [Backusella circina FSU 941]|nr:hypothetical protein K501DRAFT_288386 [Backusella circina FSU 941]
MDLRTEDRLYISNQYTSLLSLIDSVYPPLLCNLCDTTFNTRAASNTHFNEQHKKKPRYLCIHPHCEHKFASRGALRFHISRSHLVNAASALLPTPSTSTTTTTAAEASCTAAAAATAAIVKTIHKTNNNNNNKHHPIIKKPSTNGGVNTATIHHITTTTTTTTTTATTTTNKNKTPSPSPPLSPLSTPSPPASPFSLYKKHSKKPSLSPKAEAFLNSIYPPLECPSCHDLFNKKTNVIKHLTEAHLGQEPYRCIYPKCAHPRWYATREGLVYHIMRVHDS